MAGPGPILKEAHRLRQHLQELDARITQAPRQLALQKAKLQSAEDNLKAAQDEIKQLKVKINDRELSVKTTFQQIAKWEKQRETAGNSKEYEALLHEVSAAQDRVKAFEDEIFEAMTDVEDKAGKLPGVEAITKQIRLEVATFEKEYDSRIEKFTADRSKTAEELKGVETQVPEDVLPVYSKMVKARGAGAFGKIEGRTCMACNTELTPQNASEINRGLFVTCKSCGRMLYA
ncbi:MAG: C4-type zinc ribbon domain-containing protein [Planctomycetota bacterium]